MAAKFLHSLTDDNAELQRQMGCMTGIFQLFDRQRMLTGTRRVSGYSTKGNPHLNVRPSEGDPSTWQLKSASMEKYSTKNIQERQKLSVGSSRAASSSSSSFSSIDFARVNQMESASFHKMMYPDNPSRDPATGHQNHDIRDFVKDSMYRELPALKAKVTDGSHGSTVDRKQSAPADVKKYLQALDKFQQGALYSEYRNEPQELFRSSSYRSKDASSSSISRDTPRLSCDGRDVSAAAFDSYDRSKSFGNLKDSRRPLGSRQDSRSSCFKPVDNGNVVQGQRQRMECKAQRPSIIAKLMGLEATPDTMAGSDRSFVEDGSSSSLSSPMETTSKKSVQLSGSYLNSWKEPSSPNWRRNSDSSAKPATFFPIEPAPWKHTDVSRSSRKPASKVMQPPVIPSVYSEIDKRLEDLEFLQSGKDLRALKQILGTMQGKMIPETVKGQCANLFTDTGFEQKGLSYSRAFDNRKPMPQESMAFARKKVISLQSSDSPIVIMKPNKYFEKNDMLPASGISLDSMLELAKQGSGEQADNRKRFSRERTFGEHGSIVNTDSMKDRRTFKATESSVKSHQSANDGNASLNKPRTVRKKTELEKKPPCPNSPDSCRSRRHPNQQQSEVTSPSQRRRIVPSSLQQTDDQKSVTCTEITNLSSSEVEDSAQSSVASDIKNVQESAVTSSEEESAESSFVPAEHSSPVSVLDGGAHKPNTSPIKYVRKALKVDASVKEEKKPTPNVVHLTRVDSDSKEATVAYDFDRKKLQNIENLVLKLRRVNSSHDESRTDYIASLCDDSNPDHRYISEVLLASGILLRALTDFHFHPSGHPINPELFLVLEQTKRCTSSQGPCGAKKEPRIANREKNHRKLVFDAINEILSKKLSSIGPMSRPHGSAPKTMTSQMLLRDLCSEMDALQGGNPRDEEWKSMVASDMMKTPSERWMDLKHETSGAVLDVERMIFRDLVSEIVVGDAAAGG